MMIASGIICSNYNHLREQKEGMKILWYSWHIISCTPLVLFFLFITDCIKIWFERRQRHKKSEIYDRSEAEGVPDAIKMCVTSSLLIYLMSVRSRDFIYPFSFLMIYSVTIIFTFFFRDIPLSHLSLSHPSLSSSPGISCFHFWLLNNVFSELDHDDGDHLILPPTSYALHSFRSWWWRLQPESNKHFVYSWSSSSSSLDIMMMVMEEKEVWFRVCFCSFPQRASSSKSVFCSHLFVKFLHYKDLHGSEDRFHQDLNCAHKHKHSC